MPIFEYIPLENQIEKYQQEYYDAIDACNRKGNSNVFIEFVLTMIKEVLDATNEQAKKENGDASSYVKEMLSLMEYDLPYASQEIMDMLGLKSKENPRKNYINPAIKLGLMEMTLPDKHNSKNQRYIKK